jgi:hypothetical protein
MDSGKEAPAHPQVLFDDSSLIIGKAPLGYQADKNHEILQLDWATGGLIDVQCQRLRGKNSSSRLGQNLQGRGRAEVGGWRPRA